MSPTSKNSRMVKMLSGRQRDDGFYNVDLEIHSRRSLPALEKELAPRCSILFSGPMRSTRHFLCLESSRFFKTPNATIRALCKLIEQLSPASRKLWDSSRKVFSIGYGFKPSARMSEYTISHDVIERIAALGGELGVTFYNEVNMGTYRGTL